MKFEKPKLRRCYVEVRDAEDKKPRRFATIYDATPDQIIERLKGEGGRPGERKRVKEPAS